MENDKLKYHFLSKLISRALRHQPRKFGVQQDSEGWVSIESLIAGIKKYRAPRSLEWTFLDEEYLMACLESIPKKRFEVKKDKIRALYGHSLNNQVAKDPAHPPAVLYHGTSSATLQSIMASGLKPMSRQFVHLSTNIEEAKKIGVRKGKHITILKVDAARAHKSNIEFFFGNGDIWLTHHLPPEFLTLVSQPT